jgi:flagellin
MALFVNTNVSALNGQKNLMNVTNRMNSSFEKLSSGSRINSAKDDAAGLQISDRLTTQIIGLQQGTRNANDGISIAQIAEGALSEVTNNVQRMRQLVVQGGNRTLSAEDRDALGQEFEKLLSVNDDIAERTAFGTMKILNYDSNISGFQIQSGAQSGEQDTVTTGNAKLTDLFINNMVDNNVTQSYQNFAGSTLSEFGIMGEITAAYIATGNASAVSLAAIDLFGAAISTGATGPASNLLADSATIQIVESALTQILTIESAVNKFAGNVSTLESITLIGANVTDAFVTGSNVSDAQHNDLLNFATDVLLDTMSALVTQVDTMRAKLGAEQNGLSSTIRSNTTAIVNVSDSRSRITDTDFAAETAELTRNQIIQQASTSILAQANQLPQAALSLLG